LPGSPDFHFSVLGPNFHFIALFGKGLSGAGRTRARAWAQAGPGAAELVALIFKNASDE